MPKDDEVTPETVTSAWDESPYGPVLRDDRLRRQMIVDAMVRSDDPMTREIGEQLRSGTVTPRQLVTSDVYQDYFRAALRTGESIDLAKLHSALPSLLADGRLTGDAGRDLAGEKPAADRERTERR